MASSFAATLEVGSFSTPLNFVHLNINQSVDSLGRPSSLTRGGVITVEFNSTADSVVAEWMTNPAKRMDGTVSYHQLGMKVPLKTLVFTNAYCINLIENFDGTANSSQMVTTITISPEFIVVGDIKLDNRWPATE